MHPFAALSRRLLVLAAAAATATVLAGGVARAAFLKDVPQPLTQPDGTVVQLLATGDEYYNRLHDANGYTVVRDPDPGVLVYAVKSGGRREPSGFVVGRDDPAAAGLRPGLKPDPWTLPSPEAAYPIPGRARAARALSAVPAPAFTAINNVVIFISFSDEATPGFKTIDTYRSLFNTSSTSMKQYFLEASYGQLTVGSTFYPPASGATVVPYKDAHARAYYKPYDEVRNPGGYTDGNRMDREWTLLQAAVGAVAQKVPSSLDLDTNDDGFVDSVVFVVSGTASNADWSNLLWPHSAGMDTDNYPAVINGKLVADYDLQLDGNVHGSGVLCHEMTHTLGAPDLYRYSTCSDESDLDPVGPWDLMATDANPPQHTTAYLKWRYLGFLSAIPWITPPASVTLSPLTSAAGSYGRIASPNAAGEYFVVEYRRATGAFEGSLPASGLLVYRIDTAADGQGNACGPPDEVYVYRPNGTATSDGILNWAVLDGGAVPPRTAINDSTNPASLLSAGYPGGLSIHDVGPAGSTISFVVDAVAPCSKPGPFALASPANGANLPAGGNATLAWNAAAGADSYDVHFGSGVNPPLLGNQTATSVDVSVTAGQTYFWYVVARNECSQSFAPSSGSWAFTVGATEPGITILSDDFENGLSQWSLEYTSNAVDTTWGTVGCRTSSGSGAAWCAAGGSANQPPCTQYVANQGTFMVAGPFSLEDAVDGTWDFDLWTDIDDGGDPANPSDLVYWVWSLDGQWFDGSWASGSTGGWRHVTVDMRDMQTESGTPVLGQKRVWFAFVFVSGSSPHGEGAYVDNVRIRKLVGGQPNFQHWIPAVIHKDVASKGAYWRSDVAVLNRSSAAGSLTVSVLAPSGAKTTTVPIAGSAQVLLRDVAGQLGVTADSGALEVVSDVDVFVSGRTYNQVDATHTYGQGYDGQAPAELLSEGGTAWLPGLVENALYRTNVGVTNTGTGTASVTVTLYDAAGNQVGASLTRTYAAGEFYQYQQPYLAAGAIESGYASVAVNSGSGVVAYASVIDQQTNDPTTIGMKR